MRMASNWLVVGLALALAGCGAQAGPIQHELGRTAPAASATPAPVTSPASPAPTLQGVDFPRFTHTGIGRQGDPVNLLVAGTRDQVVALFQTAGWDKPDPVTPATAARMVRADLTNGSYPTAPVSDLYLYNRVQDLAFEKNAQSIKARDHFRLWQTPLTDRSGRPFWAIAASHDSSVKWLKGHPTHRIAPDIDSERDLVAADIRRVAPAALQYDLASLPVGYSGKNGEDDPFVTDGRVLVFELQAGDFPAMGTLSGS